MLRRPQPHRKALRTLGLSVLLLLSTRALATEPETTSLAFGISLNGPPLAFKRDGVIKGLQIDLARALAEALERDLQLKQLPESRITDALRGGRVDLIFSALPGQELDALGLVPSVPVLATGQMALTRTQDISRFPRLIDLKLTDARVGYKRASLGARFAEAQLPRAERVPFGSAAEGITALRDGGIDVFIHDATMAWLLAADPDETELSAIYRPLTNEQMRLVTRGEDAGLRQELNRILSSWMRSGRLEQFISRWIPVQIRISSRISRRGPAVQPSSTPTAPKPANRPGTT